MVAEKFGKLCEQFNTAFQQSIALQNNSDKAKLERLQKTAAREKNLPLSVKIKDALDRVQAGDAFDAEEAGPKKRLSASETEFWRIKSERDKALTAARKSTANRHKTQFNQLLNEALSAQDFETATQVKEFIEALTLPVISMEKQLTGTAWECDSPATIYKFEERNIFTANDYTSKPGNSPWSTAKGTWKITSSGAIQVTVESGGWRHTKVGTYTFRISPGGNYLARSDGTRWTLRKK